MGFREDIKLRKNLAQPLNLDMQQRSQHARDKKTVPFSWAGKYEVRSRQAVHTWGSAASSCTAD